MPQSITNGVSLTITRLAGLEGARPTRGPPLVPRKTIRVRGLADCASTAGAARSAALPSASFNASRRWIMGKLPSTSSDVGRSLAPAQHAVECGQADDDGRRDQGIADAAEQRLAGLAEQRRAEPHADAVDRADQERELDRIGRDQAAEEIADEGKEIRGAEEQ